MYGIVKINTVIVIYHSFFFILFFPSNVKFNIIGRNNEILIEAYQLIDK